MDTKEFEHQFELLTDRLPLAWQTRLFREAFLAGNCCLPQIIDLPTGLGKTMLMVLWLIAWVNKLDVPRRLIYVVDRRTVIDQATDLADKLAKNWEKLIAHLKQAGIDCNDAPLAISTLRGQRADNREWSNDLSQPAIIIGTVDLIGSALLFSGYRSSFKRRPLEAGLLGHDSLLLLDEAHLSEPFAKLLGSIEKFNASHADGIMPGKPLQVIRMSATSGDVHSSETSASKLPGDGSKERTETFRLEMDAEGNLKGADAEDGIISQRFGAAKALSVVTAGKLIPEIVEQANELALAKSGSRIVIFVRTPKLVGEARDALKKKNKHYATRIAQLTGTMRGLERDKLVDMKHPIAEHEHERRVMRRFLEAEDESSEDSCFLISTSAGEVGFDLNADHLIGDEAPLDSWIQRLGRVNRRGMGEATVILVVDGKREKKSDFERACAATTELLREVADVSPKALAALKKRWTQEQIQEASSPRPATVELTDILLDAWSMTCIVEPMPGRPPVAPWLRGLADEQSQTTIAWRAEIDLLAKDSAPEEALRRIFNKHPLRAHESLAVNTAYLLDFLKQIPKLKNRPADLLATRVAIRLPRGQVECRTLEQLIDQPRILFAETTLIFPANFGGLNAGILDAESIPASRKAGDPDAISLDQADHPGYEQREDAAPRLRAIMRRMHDGRWKAESLSGGVDVFQRRKLKDEYETSRSLIDDLRGSDLRARLVQPIEYDDDDGNMKCSLVLLSPVLNKSKNADESLSAHVSAVRAEAERIADALRLADDDPIRIALLFAARWHDEGKKADIWQKFVYRQEGEDFKGKTARTRDPKSLRGYRHEFGSLLRILYPDRHGTVGCELPDDATVRILALHLNATHHGFGRPYFKTPRDREFVTSECEATHVEIIRRFARLQRKYGWWRLAWLESLLRCADALASADDVSEDDPADVEGDDS